MRHLLMDPAFPDIVGDWARDEKEQRKVCPTANDNRKDADFFSDPLLTLFAKSEVAADRLW